MIAVSAVTAIIAIIGIIAIIVAQVGRLTTDIITRDTRPEAVKSRNSCCRLTIFTQEHQGGRGSPKDHRLLLELNYIINRLLHELEIAIVIAIAIVIVLVIVLVIVMESVV